MLWRLSIVLVFSVKNICFSNTPQKKNSSPIGNHAFYMLIETSGSKSAHDEAKLLDFLEHTTNAGHVHNGTVTTDAAKMAVGFHHYAYSVVHDITVCMKAERTTKAKACRSLVTRV